MKPRKNFLQVAIPDSETFADVRRGWPDGFVVACLERLWRGWDDLLHYLASQNIDPRAVRWEEIEQKERSLAHLHSLYVINRQCPEDPFLFRPEAHEMEMLHSARAMPPSYDFAFYLRTGNFRVALPVEAKYLLHAQDIQRLCADLTEKYLSGVGAPFSPVAGILGYVLSGSPEDVFRNIQLYLSVDLSSASDFLSRPHRVGRFSRHIEHAAQDAFDCHWLMCGWDTVSRADEPGTGEPPPPALTPGDAAIIAP